MEKTKQRDGKSRWIIWAAIVVIMVGIGAAGVKILIEQKVSDAITRSGGTAESAKFDFFGNIHLRNVTLPVPDGTTVRISAVDGRPKFLFLNGMLDISGVEVDTRMGKVTVAQATIEDAEIHAGALAEIFLGKNDLTAMERLKSFTAKKISAPEVTFTQSIESSQQRAVYKNLVFNEFGSGRVSRYAIESLDFQLASDSPFEDGVQTKQIKGNSGELTGQDLDVLYMLRFYTQKAGPDDKEAKPLYGPASVKNIRFSDGDKNFSYDEVRTNGFSMRMPAEPIVETLKKINSTTNYEDLSPEEITAIFAPAISFMDIIEKGDVQFLGVKVDGPSRQNQDPSTKVKVAVDRVAFDFGNRKLDMGLYGLAVNEGSDTIKVAEASVTGFSWSSSLEGFTKLLGLTEQERAAFPRTLLIPEFGTLRIAGVDVDTSKPGSIATEETEQEPDEASAIATERLRFALKSFELALTKPYNGIPTDIRFQQEDLTIQVPTESTEEMYVTMRRMGVENVSLSYNVALAWDEPNNSLLIKEISLGSKGLGSVSLTGTVGGFTKEFFSLDNDLAQLALFGLTARELKLSVKDEGVMSKIVKVAAEENDMTEEQMRGMLTISATVALQQFVSAQPNLQPAVDAVLQFFQTPGSLNVTAKSKSEAGVGVFDFIAASENPAALLDKVDIEAKAH
ncbi:hypothetical protein RMR16_024765 (plasmid) [Agrobacterium sp. rho-13.3]|uniref:hypothetical protein n=1 Tax=Agrobacterium sp. rho-13.3 TaxID=3072980 RepID=UPI002A164D3C|nr:hypothetical protein [Agrobacterium sp. rho-13.3]MDX8310165.1 hypothetical protein [Agrobacterium sp. rho-13.3]